MNATPESQAVVVLRAMQQVYPGSTIGRKRNAHVVVVRGAGSKDRGRVAALARQYSHGFTLDIRYMDGYYTIALNVKEEAGHVSEGERGGHAQEKGHEVHPLWEGPVFE